MRKYGTGCTKITKGQMKECISKRHTISMSLQQFGTARHAVVEYHQLVVLEQDYRKFPVFLDSTCNRNQVTATIALQKEKGTY